MRYGRAVSSPFYQSRTGVFLGESLLHWSYLAALLLVCAGIWMVTRPSPSAMRPAL